jgi:heme/copper-type cytochrome/quinol oxidase subunit 2
MGFVGSWWRTGWIWTAIAVFVAVLIVMGALSVPYHQARAWKEDAVAESPLARSRPMALLLTGVVALIALFFLMVVKPF